MNVHEMAELLKKEGRVTLDHAGCRLTLDMEYRHERLYAIKLMTGMAYPQADIDTKLTDRFVRSGDRVLDAGANIGFTALEFIKAGAAHVTALEPVSSLYARLEGLRGHALTPRPDALAASVGRSSMYISEGHNQGSSLSELITQYFPTIFGSKMEDVSVTTIDHLMETGSIFDIWKIDIEGGELEALKGAQKTLSLCPPRVILAEIFDPFLEDFISELPSEFIYRRRAYLDENSYDLILQPIDIPVSRSVHHHSPMYVFARESL